ncbi:MAG: VWA domain-containing protein [Planctomycetaceae bacterium]|jgi:uncharacterized protein YegL|nr:VWA domain-containing protein [Planctomycetaceae bacterium]
MYNDLEVRMSELINNPSNRVPVVLCLDVSYSMDGKPMEELNEGVRQFIKSVKEDPIASSAVELCVVTFSNDANVVADFRELTSFDECLTLTAIRGSTNLGAGVNLALDLLEQRKSEYQKVGVEYYQPWMVLMTDGAPTTDTHLQAADRTNRLLAERKLVVFSIGIGNKANMEVLALFSGKNKPKRLKGLGFRLFFDWLSQSVTVVSQSALGDSPHLPPTSDWSLN